MNGPMRDGATLSDNSKGAALMTGASLAFVLNDFMMKLVFNELSVVQGVFSSWAVRLPSLNAYLLTSTTAIFVRAARRPWHNRLPYFA